MLFPEEKGKKALRSIAGLSLMLMRQGPLGLRAEILGIHAHMGWRGGGQGMVSTSQCSGLSPHQRGGGCPAPPVNALCLERTWGLQSPTWHHHVSSLLCGAAGCRADCSWEFHEYWFAEHCAYKADGERRRIWCYQLLTTDFRVEGCAHTPGHLPLSFPLQGPGTAPPAGLHSIIATTQRGAREEEHGHSLSDLTGCSNDILKMNIDPR